MNTPRFICKTTLVFWLLIFIRGFSHGQSLDVTFRWIPDRNVAHAFLPGEFNGWGPNSGGRIAVGAPSQMSYDHNSGQWLYTHSLEVGKSYQYKVHVHVNQSGSNNVWITDPLNDQINPNDNNNSVITVADPMIFQMARHRNDNGAVIAVSAGIFSSTAITSLTVRVNSDEFDGLPHYSDGIFNYPLISPIQCDVEFTITAVDAAGNTVTQTVGTRLPEAIDRPRPVHIEDGVNYDSSDPSKVMLSVFAPGKCSMHVIGDFNDWQVGEMGLMYRDAPRPDSVHWWLPIENLSPGQEIGYQYLADQEIRFADMFSTLILDPVHDASISKGSYPNLKPYPHGKTQGPVSVLQTGQSPYSWNVTDFTPAPAEELIIYELLLRDFLHAHDWSTLTDTLGYLKHLGINAIELMPIAEFGGNLNWGYQPNFFFAPDKYYGPAEDLKGFIDAAHAHGIAVFLDVVYNHVDAPSPLVLLYGTSDMNPWINIPPTHAYNVFFDLNHENTYTQYWLDRVNAYWLTEFNIDGFRFDLSKGFTQRNTGSDFMSWDRYDSSRIRLIKRMADSMWAINPEAHIILEHWTQESEEKELARHGIDLGYPGMMVWSNVTHPYGEALMGYNHDQNSNFEQAYYGEGGRGWDLPHVIVYMESHDEQWMMYKMRSYGACERSPEGGEACSPSIIKNQETYNVRNLSIALERLKMAGAFHFLLPGPKMLWQFGELGYGYGVHGEECLRPGDCPSFAPGRTDRKPIRWNYYNDPLRKRLYDTWSALLQIRTENPIFHSTETQVSMQLSGDVKRIHLHHDVTEMQAVIIGNFGVMPATNSVQLSVPPVYWYDYFSGDSLNVTGNLPEELQPGEFHIFTSKRLPPPVPGLIMETNTSPITKSLDYSLRGSYPNPFRNQTKLEFSLDQPQKIRIEVYDILGRRISTLVNDHISAGAHSTIFESGGLSSGLYTIRMTGESGSTALSVALIR